MKKIRITKIFTVATAILFSSQCLAEEIKWTHFGVRPLAMGNAFVAVADDYNALFYNPAGLARLKEWDGEFFNPAVEVADSTVSFANELLKLADSSSSSTADTLDLFQKNAGKVHFFGISLTPHLIFPNFGIGLSLELYNSLAIHSDIDAEVNTGLQAILPISYARNFLNKKLSVGATFKLLAKAAIDDHFNVQTISAFTNSDSSEEEKNKTKIEDLIKGGYGYGADFGVLFTPIDTMEPTIGISISDIGGSVYTKANVKGESIGAPDARLPSVNTGISIKPIQSGRSYLMTAIDMHAINQPSHFSNKLNLGMEWGYGSIIKVQAGAKAGYLTAGFQFDVGLLNIRAATYAVEHAPVVALHDNLVDRRYVLQFKLLI